MQRVEKSENKALPQMSSSRQKHFSISFLKMDFHSKAGRAESEKHC